MALSWQFLETQSRQIAKFVETSSLLSSESSVISSQIEAFDRSFRYPFYLYDYSETFFYDFKQKLLEERLDIIRESILKKLQSSRPRDLETSSAMDPSRDFLTTDGKLLYELLEQVPEIVAMIRRPSSEWWQELLDVPKWTWNAIWDELVGVYAVVYAVVVSTLSLLSIVYQYLLGYSLEGGTAAYSSGTLDFRETFVSLLLFQGSYVWIFFREVAPRKVYQRSKKDEAGRIIYYGKFEPRFKPPREKLPGGTTIKFDHLPLGGYNNEHDAKIVCQIAGYHYVKDEGRIELRDGSFFTIPAVPEQEQSLCGMERARWVAARAKEIFRDFQLENNAIILPSESNAVGAHDFFHHVVSEAFSLDALWDAADAHPVDSEFVDSLCAVEEGLEGTVTSPSSADLNSVDSLIASGEGSEGTPASPSMAEQVVLVMERPQSPDLETSDADSINKRESLTQQLREHLEAEFKRRIAEQHEEHLQQMKQLEEQKTKLRLENEERISELQLEFECLRSLLR